MKKRVGLAIAHDAIRAVVVKGARLLWAGETSRDPGPPTAGDVVALLSRAPLPRWRRTPVAAAVGPHAAQLKRIAGLPTVNDARMLAAVVRENASTFFLQNGVSLAVTGIRKVETGIVWAAAIETTHVECVRDACRMRRLKLCFIAPVAGTLLHGIQSDCFHWADGPVTLEINRSHAQLISVRRISAALGIDERPAETVPALAPLGEDAARFADAYGAAVAGVGDTLTLGPAGDVPWERRRFRRRLLPPLLLAVLAAAALLLSPLYPVLIARRAEASLRRLHGSEEWRLAGEVLPQLERVTAVLADLDRFGASRPQRSRLLAALATSLPGQSAIVRLEVRNNEARMVVLTARSPEVIAAVEAIPGITSAGQTGQVVRQNVAGNELERISLTFQYHEQASRGRATEDRR